MKDTPTLRIVLGVIMIFSNAFLRLDQNTWLGQILPAALAFGGLFFLISGIVMAVKKRRSGSGKAN
jgi:hypothetical protein